MPYSIRKQGSKYCVFNKDTGDNKGCSDSREMAMKHMAALYANAGDAGKKELETDIRVALDEWVAEDVREQAKAAFTQDIIEKVKAEIGWTSGPKSIVATKQADGRVRVFMRVSNMYKDRHGEIITSEAHKEYEQHVAQSGEYPEFWLWHTPGSRWGQADLVSFDDGFLTVSGLADPGYESWALALGEQKDLGVSHGFKGISLENRGYIDWYRMKEASPLPRLEAANLWTSLAVEKGMALQDKHKKFFEAIGVSAETIQTWDKENKDIDGLLKAAGIEYKEVENPPEPEPEPKPDEKVTATLADGTTVDLPASVVNEHKAATSPETSLVLKELGKIADRLKALEERDTVSDTLETALRNGKGFVASKEGSAPSSDEAKANKDWEEELASLLLPAVGGGAN